MTTTSPGWFEAERFGLFVHFGLYSLAARHEWVRSRELMDQESYDRYLSRFDPDLFDARALARAAKEAGMRYAVLTAKHHDGFCLFESELTDYSSVRVNGRDLVGEFVTAMREEGLRVGLYYSLLDWHHPGFTVDEHHPLRSTEAADEPRDMNAYRDYLHGQVRELLTGYGQIDLLFFDFTYPSKTSADWGAQELMSTVRALQPGILVNDRLGIPGDYVTPEQYQPERPLERNGVPVRWEACHTLNGSWGYDRDNHDYKDPALLVRMLVQSVACGGNLLLNVGPTGRGALDPRARETLAAIGSWTVPHSRSVHGAGPSGLTPCGERPVHAARPSSVPSSARLAAQARTPSGTGGAGQVRAVPARRLGDRLPRSGRRRTRAHQHDAPGRTGGDADPDPADGPARCPAAGDRTGTGRGPRRR